MSELTRTCPTCDAVLQPDDQVCDACDQEFCPECLSPIAEDAFACDACGAEFEVLCPACDSEVDPAASRCPSCGYLFDTTKTEVISGRAMATQATLTEAGLRGELDLGDTTDASCPACGEGVLKLDGYCNSCGATYCPTCLAEIEEDDEICPSCGTAIFFDCPQCGFELTTGTDLCPECHALFYMICPTCDQEVAPLAELCANCGTTLEIRKRQTARVLHTVIVSDRLVRIFACTRCGEQFDSRTGVCPACALEVCVNCQLVLEEGEDVCPRCRPDLIGTVITETTQPAADAVVGEGEDGPLPARCPACTRPLAPDSDMCEACGQLVCPNCAAAVTEEDWSCPACGVAFELACPECDAEVTVEDTHCPACGTAL